MPGRDHLLQPRRVPAGFQRPLRLPEGDETPDDLLFEYVVELNQLEKLALLVQTAPGKAIS